MGYVLSFLAGCSPASQGDAPGSAGPVASAPVEPAPARAVPPEIDKRFVFAEVERDEAPPPARFGLALPADLAAGYPNRPDAPPERYVRDRLCEGDSTMTDKLVDAVKRAETAGAPSMAVAKTVGDLVRYCEPSAKRCQGAARAAQAPDSATRLVGAMMLAPCARPEDVEIFDRGETPSLAVFHWLAERRIKNQKPIFTERIGRGALELARTLDDGLELRMAAFTLAEFDDRNATRALVGMHDLAKKHRSQIAIAGTASRDPEAQALGREACAELKKDPSCARLTDPALRFPKPPKEDLKHPERIDVARMARLVTDPNVRRNLEPRLEACARAARTAFDCVIRLQLFDRKRASALARKLGPRKQFQEREMVAALSRFESASALPDHLVAAGFRPSIGRVPEAAVTARDVLEASGQVIGFDAETDQFPNEHDMLQIRLARAAEGELAAALFEETPPARDDERGPYRLCGYLEGRRWCTAARNLGDWYDLEAALGLLNTISRDRGSATRFATLATADQSAWVIVGPATGIASLADDKLIELGFADAAKQKGQGFEQQVVDELKKDGHEVVTPR